MMQGAGSAAVKSSANGTGKCQCVSCRVIRVDAEFATTTFGELPELVTQSPSRDRSKTTAALSSLLCKLDAIKQEILELKRTV